MLSSFLAARAYNDQFQKKDPECKENDNIMQFSSSTKTVSSAVALMDTKNAFVIQNIPPFVRQQMMLCQTSRR